MSFLTLAYNINQARSHIALMILCAISWTGEMIRLAPAQEAPPQVQTSGKIRGPIYSGNITWRATNDVIAMKGIVITLGEKQEAFLSFDTELLRPSLGWIGDGQRYGLTTPVFSSPLPRVVGVAAFGTLPMPGWATNGSFADPRKQARGSLPKQQSHYRGLYVHGRQVVLKYSVGDTEFLELPGFEWSGKVPVFTRTIQPLQNTVGQQLNVAYAQDATFTRTNGGMIMHHPNGHETWLTVDGAPDANWEARDGTVVLTLPKLKAHQIVRIAIASPGETPPPNPHLPLSAPVTDLRPLTAGGAPLWPDPVITKGTRAADNAAYVVDRISEPAKNPWKADVLFGGFDFFSDGRAAVCTVQGEVWTVSGLNDSLEKLEWRRFSSGLFQGLGLKIVNDQVYVLGRDQITRLHDLNGDGEADFYENFNNDTILSTNPADYSLDLDTDHAGNFYFARAAAWLPHTTTPHQGVMFKVSADGSRSEIIATGLRAPNGMAIGPHDEITVSDNQGHWQPASKLNLIQPGGFYGMVPTAQRDMELHWNGTNFTVNPSDPAVRVRHGFEGFGPNSPKPASYDRPIAWLPMNMDNSSGGQVWATTTKWGPLNDQLLFMSYGKCALFATLLHDVGGLKQAAMVPLPLKFDTGIMRGRVNPQDGQVYVAGLRGWLTSAVRPGGLYRVRYTGQPTHLPVAFVASLEGVEIKFSDPLDRKSVALTDNYDIERWNYYWSGNYGSKDYSVSRTGATGRDTLEVGAARLSSDALTISLTIPDMRPSDQLFIKLNLEGADGSRVSREVYATVPVLKSAAGETR